MSGDAGAVALIAGSSGVITTFQENIVSNDTGYSGLTANLLTDSTGMNLAHGLDLIAGFSMNRTLAAPNPVDGGILLVPLYVRSVESTLGVIRGMLRGLWYPPHVATDMLPSATGELVISGGNLLAGRSFSIRRSNASSSFNATDRCLALQKSGDVFTN
jgi:hypothetical protein